MRGGVAWFAIVLCFTACGGNSKSRGGGASGNGGTQGAEGGSGGSSTTMTGGTGGTAATGAVGGTGGSGTSVGGSGGSVGGSVGKGGTGAGKGGNGSGAVGEGGEGAQGETGGSNGSGATGGSDANGGSGATGGTAGSAGTGGSGGEAGVTVPITSCTDDFPFLGTWEGKVLDFFFAPLEDLKLELFEAEGEIAGRLTWGVEAGPLPPVESADVPWPPGFWESMDGHEFDLTPEPWSGFGYTVVRGAGCDATLRFSVSTAEVWDEWCSLQTPVYTEEYGWGCTLQGGGSSNSETCTVQPQGMTPETYPIWKCSACGAFGGDGVCACDEAGCFASKAATHTFDLSYAASGEMGILSGPDPTCGDCTVRLERK